MWFLVLLFVLGMFLMLGFLITKILGIAFSKAWAAFSDCRLPTWLSRSSFASVWALLVFFAPLRACEHYQVKLYENALPANLEVSELIYHDEQSGLMEGCGVAIFKLSESTISRIKKEGLPFFQNATIGRDERRYHEYNPWQVTPQPGSRYTGTLLRGAFCIQDPPAIWQQINEATHSQGSYFTTGSEQDIVVIPKLGIIVFSHNG